MSRLHDIGAVGPVSPPAAGAGFAAGFAALEDFCAFNGAGAGSGAGSACFCDFRERVLREKVKPSSSSS